MSEHPRPEAGLVDAAAIREGRDRLRAHGASSLTAQWTGFFLAPAVFFAHLEIAYVLVPWSCVRGNHLWLHVAGALSVLLAAAGTAIAWMVFRREGGDKPGEHGGPMPRARFLGITGAVSGALFVLLLAVQWAAAFVIGPCQ